MRQYLLTIVLLVTTTWTYAGASGDCRILELQHKMALTRKLTGPDLEAAVDAIAKSVAAESPAARLQVLLNAKLPSDTARDVFSNAEIHDNNSHFAFELLQQSERTGLMPDLTPLLQAAPVKAPGVEKYLAGHRPNANIQQQVRELTKSKMAGGNYDTLMEHLIDYLPYDVNARRAALNRVDRSLKDDVPLDSDQRSFCFELIGELQRRGQLDLINQMLLQLPN